MVTITDDSYMKALRGFEITLYEQVINLPNNYVLKADHL